MSNREYIKVVYTATLRSVEHANRLGRILEEAAVQVFSDLAGAVGVHVKVGPEPKSSFAKLVFSVFLRSPTNQETLRVVRESVGRGDSLPFSVSGLLYGDTTVENANAEDTEIYNKLEDEREARKKSGQEAANLPPVLTDLLTALRASGAEVTVIRL